MKDAKQLAEELIEERSTTDGQVLPTRVTILARAYLALVEENDYLRSGGVHTCHANCQKPPCVTRRELKRAEARLERAKAALKTIKDYNGWGDSAHVAREALREIDVET